MENKISIIIPAYNIEAYIGITLDSVLAQTHSALEVIAVDDGSQDGTGRILEEYAQKDSRILVIHKENGGVTSARLCGISAASGQWIGFVDGDDYVEPQMYEKLLENALKYDADISHCGYQMVFPDRVDYYYRTGRVVLQDRISGLRDLLAGTFVEPGLWNKIYRRELFQQMQIWMDRSVRINEDLLMNYWLFKSARVAVFEDVCPYHYVLRKGSAATSNISEHKLWDPVRVLRIILEDAPPEVEGTVYQRLIRVLIGGASMDLKQDPELIRPYRDYARRELRKRIIDVITGRKCSRKLKIMALWTSVCPASYGWVHRWYSRITGNDKKYNLE